MFRWDPLSTYSHQLSFVHKGQQGILSKYSLHNFMNWLYQNISCCTSFKLQITNSGYLLKSVIYKKTQKIRFMRYFLLQSCTLCKQTKFRVKIHINITMIKYKPELTWKDKRIERMALYYLELLWIQAKDLCGTCVGVPKNRVFFFGPFWCTRVNWPRKRSTVFCWLWDSGSYYRRLKFFIWGVTAIGNGLERVWVSHFVFILLSHFFTLKVFLQYLGGFYISSNICCNPVGP